MAGYLSASMARSVSSDFNPCQPTVRQAKRVRMADRGEVTPRIRRVAGFPRPGRVRCRRPKVGVRGLRRAEPRSIVSLGVRMCHLPLARTSSRARDVKDHLVGVDGVILPGRIGLGIVEGIRPNALPCAIGIIRHHHKPVGRIESARRQSRPWRIRLGRHRPQRYCVRAGPRVAEKTSGAASGNGTLAPEK